MNSPLLLVGLLFILIVNAQENQIGVQITEKVQTTDDTNFVTKVHHVQQTTQLPVVQSTIRPQQPIVVVEQQVHNTVQPHCFWSGTAPFCRGDCGKLYRTALVNRHGDGKNCWFGVKKFCCAKNRNIGRTLIG